MQSILRYLLAVFLVACCFVLPASAQPPIGEDNGWYAVNCNVNGAQVYFGNDYKGTIEAGVLRPGLHHGNPLPDVPRRKEVTRPTTGM